MARIDLNPLVADRIDTMTLGEVAARGGVADLIEAGRLVLLSDYRLDLDFTALAAMDKSLEAVSDPAMRRKVKKMLATQFFEGKPPSWNWGRRRYADPIRQVLFDVLCRGDGKIFDRAARTLKSAHNEIERIFEIAFPNYEPYRFIPSLRITRTLHENLHWDNHSIDDDFHQARIFANIDTRPRIWNISHGFIEFMELFYDELRLDRFAGKDPNEMLAFINSDVLGGFSQWWKDQLPRHRLAFDPGEVWLGESRFLSHQIVYGECAMVYMWFMRHSSMHAPEGRFNLRVEEVHRKRSVRRGHSH